MSFDWWYRRSAEMASDQARRFCWFGGTMIRLLLLAFLTMLVLEGVAFAESGPVFSGAGPEAEEYGAMAD